MESERVYALTARHRRWLVIEQVAVPAALNLVLNAGIAWLLFRAHSRLTLWGEAGVGVDLIVTGFLLPFAICLINSRLIRRQVESGKIPPLDSSATPVGLASASSVRRAVVLAGFGVALGSLPMLAIMALAEPLPVGAFVGLKGIWAGVLAAAISPVVAWWALVAASQPVAVGAP